MKIDIYQGENSQWFWRARPAHGGRQIACGGEGFKTRAGAKRSAWNVVKRMRQIVDVDGARG